MMYVSGTYVEVQPPSRLVYTWQWGHREDETLVTVEFNDRDGGTELVLTHERFRDEPDVTLHGEGWDGCFTRLGELLAAV